jgi:hypothetical protein
VTRVVPQPDRRLGEVVLVAEDAVTLGSEQKIAPPSRFEAEPARCEHPQICALKNTTTSPRTARTRLTTRSARRGDLGWRLPTWAAVAEQLPIRALRENLGGAAALISAVVIP